MKQHNVAVPPRPLNTLSDAVQAGRTALLQEGRLTAFPHHWQVPAATEKAAWESVRSATETLPFEYWAFPWATVIDGLRGEAVTTWPVLTALRQAIQARPRPAPGVRRVTVAQHIHVLQFVELFQAAGITDLFWSHATHAQPEVNGIRLHAFPLFPAQTPDLIPPAEPVTTRKYLANFIGAYNPKIYLTNVREVIFNDPNEHDDLLIIKREAWHFDRAVYDEQIKGLAPGKDRVLTEQQLTQEYLSAIRDSWFTLCPSGAGPNSIRIFESLCLGSIPVIVTKDLRLPGNQSVWVAGCIFEEDSAEGYRRALRRARATSQACRLGMLQAGRNLAALTAAGRYLETLLQPWAATASAKVTSIAALS
jgi:hypothetical protein